MILQISKMCTKSKKSSKSSNSDFKLISTSIIIIQRGLYKSMQTIDHQIQVEITVIMQRVRAQQHTCWHHAASSHNYVMSVWVVSPDFVCRCQILVSLYCARWIPAHLMCTQCSILLHHIEICFLSCICLWQISQIQTWLSVVVGPGFVSTSPAIMRSSARHPAGPHGRLAKKSKSGPHYWRRDVWTPFSQQLAKSTVTALPLVGCVVWSFLLIFRVISMCGALYASEFAGLGVEACLD